MYVNSGFSDVSSPKSNSNNNDNNNKFLFSLCNVWSGNFYFLYFILCNAHLSIYIPFQFASYKF